MLTTAQVAERLGLSQSMIRYFRETGQLTPQKFGRDWVYQESEVEALRKKREEK
jgi:DNA-binding transcriptional MerR regulator